MLKSLKKSLQEKCMKRKSEVDNSVSVHGHENSVVMPVQGANCNCCIEESKQCNCDHINAIEGTNVDAKRDDNASSSFTHAVINMVGMLIGKLNLICVLFCFIYP